MTKIKTNNFGGEHHPEGYPGSVCWLCTHQVKETCNAKWQMIAIFKNECDHFTPWNQGTGLSDDR